MASVNIFKDRCADARTLDCKPEGRRFESDAYQMVFFRGLFLLFRFSLFRAAFCRLLRQLILCTYIGELKSQILVPLLVATLWIFESTWFEIRLVIS